MKTTRKIEEYLGGTLSDKDKQALEEQAATDKELRELIRLHSEVNDSIQDNELHFLRHDLERVSSGYFASEAYSGEITSPGMVKRLKQSWFFRIACVTLIILATAIAIKLMVFNTGSPEKLYNKFYFPYETDAISRSATAEISGLNMAVILYGRGDYNQALPLLKEITRNNETNYLASFYLGLTFLETDQAPEAVHSLSSIPESWNSPYKIHRDWYMALALLKTGDKKTALVKFDDLKASGGYYSDRAAKIIKKLGL